MRNLKEKFVILQSNVFISADRYAQGPAKSVEKLGKREKEVVSPDSEPNLQPSNDITDTPFGDQVELFDTD